jgi:hypothetical protein
MATCSQSIQTKIDNNQLSSITELFPNTSTSLSITNSVKQLYRLIIANQQTASFTLSLVSTSSPSNIGVTINFYQVIENTFFLLGSVLITELITTFQKDFTAGEYIICIGSSVFSYAGTFIGNFIGYPVYVKLPLNAYYGQALNPFELTIQYQEKECNKLIYFEIIEGKLPEGLEMTLSGNIWGVLPNMDCTSDNDALSPSQNWYYNLDNTWQPWGRQWRFKIRAWIVEYPDAWTEKWFCIRIHNNWSWDRDNQPPIEYDEEVITEVELEPILELCCEEPEEKEKFVAKPLPILCPCESESTPEQQAVLSFLQWYETVLKNPDQANPYIQSFIDNFKSSSYFSKMIIKAGLEDDSLTEQEKELRAVANLIAEYSSNLVEGRSDDDIDTIMLSLRDEQNQKLPITLVSQLGQNLSIELKEEL